MQSYAKANERLAKRYEEWMLAMHYEKHTKQRYRKTVRMFVEFLDEKSAASVTHWDIRQFMTRLTEDGASLDSIYRHLGTLRLFYDFLNLGGVVSYVAPRLVKLRRPDQRLGPLLTESQVCRLIAATRTLRERALVEFFYGTGCRLNETRCLRLEDVDLSERIARVWGKFGKFHSVLLTKAAADALAAYVGERRTGFVFQQDMPTQKGCVAKRGTYWVGMWIDYRDPLHRRQAKQLGRLDVVSYESARSRLDALLDGVLLARPKPNRPLSKMAVQTLLQHVGERAGLKAVSPHMLRRSFASHLYDHGASLDVIQGLLGHSWQQTTERYVRLSTGRLVKVFEQCHPRRNMNVQESEQDGPPRQATPEG